MTITTNFQRDDQCSGANEFCCEIMQFDTSQCKFIYSVILDQSGPFMFWTLFSSFGFICMFIIRKMKVETTQPITGPQIRLFVLNEVCRSIFPFIGCRFMFTINRWDIPDCAFKQI